jgi:uncharacterized protein (TIRG00374 family)
MENSPTLKPKKRIRFAYWFNLSLVLVLTLSIFFGNLTLNFDEVALAFQSANPWMIGFIILLMVGVFLVEALILFILARLYTSRYSVPKALANSMVGHFYSAITPGHSGGQFAQAYTFKQQGLSIANAASILVMHFILFQIALVTFGMFSLLFRYEQFSTLIPPILIGDFAFPTIYLSLAGFALNALVIVGILVLAQAKWIHNFFINGTVGLLGKLKIIKNADEIKLDTQIQIENFRIELKRLQSNIPVTVVIFSLFLLRFAIMYSIPYFAGLSISNVTVSLGWLDSIFFGAYLFLITSLVPLPGSAGAAELLFSHFYQTIFGGYIQTIAPLIIWRVSTFYLTLILGILTSAFYRSAPQEDNFKSDRKTFVQLQRATFEMRRESSTAMQNTAQMERIQRKQKVFSFFRNLFGFKRKKVDKMGRIITTAEMRRQDHEKKKRDRQS